MDEANTYLDGKLPYTPLTSPPLHGGWLLIQEVRGCCLQRYVRSISQWVQSYTEVERKA